MLNKLLAQQVQKHLGDPAKLPEAFATFIKSISESYNLFEQKINTLVTAVDNGTDELLELKKKLLNEAAGVKNAHNELSRIFDQVNEGFFSRNINTGEYIRMSVGCEKIYGYSIEEFYANSLLWFQVIVEEDRHLIDREHELLQKGIQTLSTYRIIHKDKSIRWIEIKAIPEIIEGHLAKVEGLVNDITARKTAEYLLRNSEIKYRSFFENNIDGILLSKPDGTIDEANPAACRIFNVTEKEIREFSRPELLQFANPELLTLLAERDRTGKVSGEGVFMRRDGSKFSAEIASSIFTDANGEIRTCIIIRDITERKKSEAAMLMNERELDLIYNTVSDAIFMINIEAENRFKFVSVNTTFLKTTGLQKEMVVGKYIDEVIPSPSLEFVLDKYARAINLKQTVSWEEKTEYPAGLKIGLVSVNPVLNEIGDCTRLIGSVHDITERKKTEQLVADSERRYRTLFEQNLTGIYQTSINGEIISCNQAFATMLGYASPRDLEKTSAINLFFSVIDRSHFISLLRDQKKLYNYEGILKQRDGSPLHIIENISLFKDPVTGEEVCDGMMIDITKRKNAESKL
ncbi:MAG: PAS domain-containing protein, partial [Ferruginibacter sp.]